MFFNASQVFYLDKNLVNADHIALTSVDLFFKNKPQRTNNKSGINSPGVTVYITKTTSDDVPDVSSIPQNSSTVLEYDSILISANASAKTNAKFTTPIILPTGFWYAVVLVYDGDEDFDVWKYKEGQQVVGTNIIAGVNTSKNVGKYYEYGSLQTTNGNATPVAASSLLWKPLNDTDMKLVVYIANFAISSGNTATSNGIVDTPPVSANNGSNTSTTTPPITGNTGSFTNTYILPVARQEFVVYDRAHSKTRHYDACNLGEQVFQLTPVTLGSITVQRGNTRIAAVNNSVNFTQLFSASSIDKQFLVLIDPAKSSGDPQMHEIREVVEVVSNTVVVLDRAPSFTNTASFMITPTAQLMHRPWFYYHGRWWDGISNTLRSWAGRRTDALILTKSTANASCRFVNNMVEGITISAGGSSYANSDRVVVFTNNSANSVLSSIPNLNAVANVITASNGSIVSLKYTNSGFGLFGNVNYTILNANNIASTGTGANLVIDIGTTLVAEFSNAQYSNCVFTNMDMHRFYPNWMMIRDRHHSIDCRHHLWWYVFQGHEHVLNRMSTPHCVPVVSNTLCHLDSAPFDDGRVFVNPSYSNYVANTSTDITTSTGATVNVGTVASVLEVNVSSNSIFSVPVIISSDVYSFSYIINNDATNEHKNYGNALAKHISSKINFGEGRFAEDLIIQVRAHRPPNTNIKVYAKVHNSTDVDAYDDKDWSLLECKIGNTQYSSLTNANDFIEFTYSLGNYPSSVNTATGFFIASLNNTQVKALSTNVQAYCVASDLVKVYDPLFPNTNYWIGVVNNVVNSSTIELRSPITNNGVTGYNLKLDLIGRPANGANAEIGLPHSAYIDMMNSNVVTYHTDNMSKFTTYDTASIKVIFLSESRSIVPKLDDIRLVGVSA